MRLLEEKTRVPTPEERAKERSVLYSGIADVGIIFLQVSFALITGSLTLLSESVRSIMMLTVDGYSLWLLAVVHRDRLRHFNPYSSDSINNPYGAGNPYSGNNIYVVPSR